MPHPAMRRSPAPRRFDHGQPIRGIDTRPMLFVALFIAVVFLLAASQTPTHALLVDLRPPPANLPDEADPPIVLRIRVTPEDAILFNGVAVDSGQLEALLNHASTLEPRALLAFEPDGNASYNLSVHTLALIQRAGLIDPWFCMDGMRQHKDFGKSYGHPMPLLFSLQLERRPRFDVPGAEAMLPKTDTDCIPAPLHQPR